MSLKTKLLELFKYEPDKDGAQTFNIKSALNDNWDKIEAWAQSVKTALTKLVPTSRTVNGKTLAEDVTLTAADIKMPDSEEDVGAAMAKRLKDCGELSGQNDADTLTEPGFYRGGDTSKMLLHAPIFSYAWTLEVLANSAWNVGVTQRFIDYETRRMYIRANHTIESGWVWYDWMEVAQCVVPEVHDLPLANGWLTYGTSINWYSKDQFGQVTIYFRLKSTVTTITDSITIANIPEGFRPQHGMSIPGLLTFDNYTRLPCHVDIVPSGALQLYVDGTAPSGRSVIELTCAEFHYPAK